MKLQLLSDLHNECYRRVPPIPASDSEVVVLAGDIGVGLDGLRWAGEQAARLGKPVLYVAGNHEFYGHDLALLQTMRTYAAMMDGLYLLEQDSLVFNDTRFLGCTLWTDYQAAGDPLQAMAVVAQGLSDHHEIRHGRRRFSPQDALALHQQSRQWLEAELATPFTGNTVVITHHGPSLRCQHPRYPLDAFSTAFISDLAELVGQADLWCFGHTHANLDVRVDGCRLVSNQRGYPREGVLGFDPARVVVV